MQSSRVRHPSTFILFRPHNQAEAIEEDEDMPFRAELDCKPTTTTVLKKSCPALLGTASKKLQIIDEDKKDDESDISFENSFSEIDVTRPRIDTNNWLLGEPSIPQKLSKKRSFLLVDVLDDVEGVRSHKKQDVHDTASTLSTDSIEIGHSSSRPTHRIRRRRSDFDVLYADSRSHENKIGQHIRDTREAQTGATEQPCAAADFSSAKSVSIASSSLRSKKSMITLSLQKLNSAPPRSKLDGIDTHELTSFDVVLKDCSDLKSSIASTVLDTSTKLVPLSDAHDKINRTKSPQTVQTPRFAKQTELLRQLPDTTCKPRRARRDLRHAKSARDMLEKYKVEDEKSSRRCVSAMKPDRSREPEAEKSCTTISSLKNNLLSLLKLNKPG